MITVRNYPVYDLGELVEDVNHCANYQHCMETLDNLISYLSAHELTKEQKKFYPTLSLEEAQNLKRMLNTKHAKLGFDSLEEQFCYIYRIEYKANRKDFIPLNKNFNELFTDILTGEWVNKADLRYGDVVLNHFLCWLEIANVNHQPRKAPELMPKYFYYMDKALKVFEDKKDYIQSLPSSVKFEDSYFAGFYIGLSKDYYAIKDYEKACATILRLESLNLDMNKETLCLYANQKEKILKKFNPNLIEG